jgi:hypothetical protein
MTAQTNDKFPIYSYYQTKSHNEFLVRYLNTLPGIQNLFYFCQVYIPDRFIVKKLDLKINTISTLIRDQKKAA